MEYFNENLCFFDLLLTNKAETGTIEKKSLTKERGVTRVAE